VRKKPEPAKTPAEPSLGIDLEFKANIPRSVLARLLDMAGNPEGISPRPLMGEPGKLYPFQLAELYASDFIELPKDGNVVLSPAFLRIARALLNPKTNLTFRIWGEYSICAETNIQFPGHIIDGGGVILNQVGKSYQLSAFVSDAEILKLLGPLLTEDPAEKNDFQFEGHLDASVVAVLFGFIDLARRQVRSKESAKAAENETVFTSQQVNEYLYKEWGVTGFEDLVTYITATSMKFDPPSLSEIGQGLETLAKADVLTKIDKDKFTLSPVLAPLVYLTTGNQAGLQWQRVTQIESNELLWSNRIFIFFGKSMILQFSPTIENKVYISRVTRDDIIKFLTEEFTLPALLVSVGEATLDGIPARPLAPVKTVSADRTAAVKPVGEKGNQPVPEEIRRPEVRTTRPVTEATPPPETVCRYCGRINAGTAVTCKYCGQLLAGSRSAQIGIKHPQSAPPAATALQTASVQKQLQELQQEMQSYKLELSKLEVQWKIGELSTRQYQDSVSELQAKIQKIENTAERLARQI
jgi:hypothetical protein